MGALVVLAREGDDSSARSRSNNDGRVEESKVVSLNRRGWAMEQSLLETTEMLNKH
jgi:hypothetical protein